MADRERELARASFCISGDNQAWRELIDSTVSGVSRMVRKTLRRFGVPPDDREVEEISLGVYSRLWEEGCHRLRLFRGDCSLETWVTGLARLEAIERAGEIRKHREKGDKYIFGEVPKMYLSPFSTTAPSDSLERRELSVRVKEALSKLPVEDRELIRLLYEENLSYRRIAGRLRIHWTTLSARLAKIKNRLAEHLRDNLFCL